MTSLFGVFGRLELTGVDFLVQEATPFISKTVEALSDRVVYAGG